MATLHPPEPASDHEALFEIYAAVQVMQRTLDQLVEHVASQNGRIGKLEDWRARVMGGIKVVSVVAGVVGGVAGWLARGLLGGGP